MLLIATALSIEISKLNPKNNQITNIYCRAPMHDNYTAQLEVRMKLTKPTTTKPNTAGLFFCREINGDPTEQWTPIALFEVDGELWVEDASYGEKIPLDEHCAALDWEWCKAA